MMTKSRRFRLRPLALAVASASLVSLATPVQAISFNWGEIEGTFDSTWSYGQSWRVEDRNMNIIGKSNQPAFDWSGYNPALNTKYSSQDIFAYPKGGYSTNGDNGNLSYDSGETFSKVFKGLHELELRYENMGIFVRGMYFYDFALNDDDSAWTNPTSGNLHDPCEDSKASDYSCKDVRLLDYFFYADFDLADGDIPVSFKIGDQVISWGESTFIPHGIGVVNPVDVARLQTPGAELKEVFIPQGMAWVSVGLTENLALEAFYQYEWESLRLPTPGTYFSTNDFTGKGGYLSTVQLGFTANPDQDLAFLTERLNNISSEYEQVVGADLPTLLATLDQLEPGSAAWTELYTALMGIYVASPGTQALVMPENEPDDGGQYGLKVSYYSPALGDTEFGLYYMNYHSRRPLISAYASDFTPSGVLSDLNMIANTEIDKNNVNELQAFTKGFLDYPEDLKLIGLSFNTPVGDTTISGEIAYRPDEPLQIDDVEILFATMPEQLAYAGIRPELADISQVGPLEPGEFLQGYIERDTTQMQFTAVHLFGPQLGSDNLTVLGEVGGIWIDDMPGFNELRLNGPGTSRSGGIEGKEGLEIALHNGPESNPFPDDFSWGYRMLAKLDYNNAFWGMNVSPRIVFAHDVQGITPDPIAVFVEDRKSLGVGVSFDYLQRWSAGFNYNAYWGGQGTTNLLDDRDFVSFNIKYSI
ncbi:DUF1302 domain-containing protein [Neiella marina]|uniref:DUF1302 domain-containing protein n=1 Tax=Neiella holothuriorum TaxID=2870530 RepID=A0ABS7EDE3_9GAMM|nr:DUF1302 domain-containing protein [Neiella holothuriorum]MBW8190275.1 DUF1302 domain-containing protein [Neiella holothuriorum]